MRFYSFLSILCQFYQSPYTKIKPKLKRSILNFGCGINYKYEGMLVHSFDRFYVVTKLILHLIGDLKFSNLNYDNTCAYLCHRHGIRVKEKMERFGCICSNQGFQCGCQQMCRQTMALPVHMHSGFPTGRSKQMIVTSWNDITMIYCAILGGNYKRRAHQNLRAVIWVFRY